jgi:periplasmic divalent cation tolerance protein
MRPIAVYTTVATVEEARRIASALVERRLVACAQIEAIESFYWWKDAVQNEPEWRLLLKTTDARYAEVEAAIRELHGYELPAIHAISFQHAYEPYAQWIAASSCGPGR